MHSMTQDQRPVVIGGVDAHADTHHAAVLDARGALLATRQFCATATGYEQLIGWLQDFGRVIGVAVESTSSYCRGVDPRAARPRDHGGGGQSAPRAHAPAARQDRRDRC